MRGGKDHPWAPGDRWLEQRVQLARGQWYRDEGAGAIRSAGWWESVTVTWSPVATSRRRLPLLDRALASAVEAVTPSLARLVAAGAWRLIGRRHGTRAVLSSSPGRLPTATKALPRPGKAR